MCLGMLGKTLDVFLLAVAALYGADSPLTGPVTGFVFDAQAHAIRPMLGIPGAAAVGQAAVNSLDAAGVAPDGSAALAVRGGRLYWYSGLRSGVPEARAVNGAVAGVDRFAWSTDASAAVVYASNSHQAQVVRNAAAGPAMDLSGLPGSLMALAYDGQRIIVGMKGGVFSDDGQGSLRQIAEAGRPSAIALSGPDLYFADAEAHQIRRVQRYATRPVSDRFAQESTERMPVGLQLSSDGLRLLAAYAGSRELVVYDVASRSTLRSLALDCDPAGLERFGNASVFLLNGGNAGPLYVFHDRGGEDSAVYFVPAPPVEKWRHDVRFRTN